MTPTPRSCANPQCGKLLQSIKKRTCSNACRVALSRFNAKAFHDSEGNVADLLERTGHLTFDRSGDRAALHEATVQALKDLCRLQKLT